MSDIDWKKCLDWIKRLNFLDADEPLLRNNLKIHDFAQCLRDGVVLCRLLNALAAGIVDLREFSQRPQMSEVKSSIFALQYFLKMFPKCYFIQILNQYYKFSKTNITVFKNSLNKKSV